MLLSTLPNCDLGQPIFTLIPYIAFKYTDKSESRDSLNTMLKTAGV